MILVCILSVSGSMYGMENNENDLLRRSHSVININEKSDNNDEITVGNLNDFLECKKTGNNKVKKPKIFKIDEIDFYGKVYYAKNSKGRLFGINKIGESKENFLKRISDYCDLSEINKKS